MSVSVSSSIISKPFSKPDNSWSWSWSWSRSSCSIQRPSSTIIIAHHGLVSKCELMNEDQSTSNGSSKSKLGIGSPVIITEAPQMIKTAASVPCLRVNVDLVKSGDVGRIIARKPMDVWAVRLSIGTYLIDRKYFKPLELDE